MYILIIEDIPDQRKFLKQSLSAIGKDYHLLEAASIKEALQIIQQQEIHLFFIDIGLPDGSGLELAKTIRSFAEYELTWIVFLTTYSEYILDAFQQIHCYDYIVKPYKTEVVAALSQKLLKPQPGNSLLLQKPFLSFPMKGFVLKLNIDDILYFEMFNKTCTIHTHRQKHCIKKIPLKNIIKMIPSSIFIQCHRSYIINMNYVEYINKKQSIWEISFHGYTENAFVGETYKEQISDKLSYMISKGDI